MPPGNVGLIMLHGVGPMHLVEEFPRQHRGRITPAGDNIAVLQGGEPLRGGRGEKLGRRMKKSAGIGRIPWVLAPVRVCAGGILAVVLEDDLQVDAFILRHGDDLVPVCGHAQIKETRRRRLAHVLRKPVEVQPAPVHHPDAGPVKAGVAESGERPEVKGHAVLVGPGEICPDRHIGAPG